MFATFDPIAKAKRSSDHHHDQQGESHHHDETHESESDDHHNTPHDSEIPTAQIALDIVETSTSIYIIAPIAGVPLSEIDITLSANVLTISGERREIEIHEDVEKTLLSECFFGLFSRSVILPENLEYANISAQMENNLLEIKIPKIILPSKTVQIIQKS